MEITYKRELKHNYLIITPEEAFYDSYEIRMLASNCIEGLLKFHVKQVDNRKSYYYEITSRQPLTRILEYQSLGAEHLRCLITGIVRTLERMETYLLQEGQILLEPEYIYVEPEYFSLSHSGAAGGISGRDDGSFAISSGKGQSSGQGVRGDGIRTLPGKFKRKLWNGGSFKTDRAGSGG